MGLNPTNEKLASADITETQAAVRPGARLWTDPGVLDRSRTSREMGTEHETAGPGGLPGPSATLKSMKGRN